MEELIFEKVNEKVYKETLSNGIEVYLYPTHNTKNFYCTISVKYGARVLKYKKGNKTYNVLPGSAHFLEHKCLPLSENPVIAKRINDLGSLANAWTNYRGTNYNIFGGTNIIENLRLLLDIFYNADINDESVEGEKGIIHEEKDTSLDNINRYMFERVFKNSFYNNYYSVSVLGEHSDLDKMNAKDLDRIHSDFYIPNNTFIVVAGNFDKDEVIDEIKNYMKKLNLKKKELPKVIEKKEVDEVKSVYEEVTKDLDGISVKYTVKIKKDLFGIEDDDILSSYLRIILNSNFSESSTRYDRYKKENLIINMGASSVIAEDYVLIIVSALVNDYDAYIDVLKKEFLDLTLTEDEFTRKKKGFLKSYITSFENIEDVEYLITTSLLKYNKLLLNDYSKIINSSYKEALSVMKKINNNNYTIVRTVNSLQE